MVSADAIVRFRDGKGVVRVGVVRDDVVHECAGQTVAALVAADSATRLSGLAERPAGGHSMEAR